MNGYLVIEENAYYGYSSNRYFTDIVTAYNFYKEKKKMVDKVCLVEFKVVI